MSSRHIFVGLPAYNEEIALPRLLHRIVRSEQNIEGRLTTVIYDDGSTDRTAAIARDWQSRMPLVLLDGARNRGLGAGLSSLIDYVTVHGGVNDVLVVMDCDDTHDPAQITEMLIQIEGGADVVIASRYISGATIHGLSLFRRTTSLVATLLFKLVSPVRGVWDYTCGYRAYRVTALRLARTRYKTDLITESGFACMTELLLKLSENQARFAQVPLQLGYDRKPTASKMHVGSNIARLLKLLLLFKIKRLSRRATCVSAN